MVAFAPRMLWTGWLSVILLHSEPGPSSACSLYRGQQPWVRPCQQPGALGSGRRQEARHGAGWNHLSLFLISLEIYTARHVAFLV